MPENPHPYRPTPLPALSNSRKRHSRKTSYHWIHLTPRHGFRLRGKGHGSFQESAVDGYAKYLLDRRLATEKTAPFYLHWVRRYRDFMTQLAVEDNVAAATQNQAFNAVLFLFRHVLGKDIEDISKAVRAKKKRRLPVVLIKDEVQQLMDQMSGSSKLMAKLIYGCGLRLRECLRLRIQDLLGHRDPKTTMI